MVSPEQTAGLVEGDWVLEGTDLGSVEGVVRGKDPDCGVSGKTRTSIGKAGEEAVSIERKKPLNLLDLPVDVLKDIIKEVTHTNDLASLALTHSSLHALTIPHIYHRFDIVWPDAHATVEHRTGVDALTYGLATLVMAEEVFGEYPSQGTSAINSCSQAPACEKCGYVATPQARQENRPNVQRPRRGNHYAHFTRKFSLGNGPPEWVSDYLVTKDGGKMLGTLVALAIARMPSLETFVWDMPTGVLRDVWLALSSLGDCRGGRESRLERVWVRWHDNQDIAPGDGQALVPSLPSLVGASVGFLVPPSNATNLVGLPATPGYPQSPIVSRVEHPTFSVLPPLKSLSVLDIDELAYLDEMSILIGRSQDRLRELRVGISSRGSMPKSWVLPWDGESLQQVDHSMTSTGTSTIGEKRLGGVLGILVGRVYDIRKRKRKASTEAAKTGGKLFQVSEGVQLIHPADQAGLVVSPTDSGVSETEASDSHTTDEASIQSIATTPHVSSASVGEEPQIPFPSVPLEGHQNSQINEVHPPPSAAVYTPASTQASPGLPPTAIPGVPMLDSSPAPSPQTIQDIQATAPAPTPILLSQGTTISRDRDLRRSVLEGKLKLEVLELERVPLSIPVLQKAFDWSIMTSLTLLGCSSTEYLWKMLRQVFSPFAAGGGGLSYINRTSRSLKSAGPLDYKLKLRKIHTDTVGPALISLLRETLAPNTLEVLFLKESSFGSSVSIDAMYRGPLRRHRLSLKKLFIDSSLREQNGATSQASWRKWMFPREVLGYVTSGKMSSLRELGMVVEYKDWHYLLQRIPLIPHLRSLYIPHIADHVHTDPREMALQIVDIVALRSEVEICYMGILNKCFEILENKNGDEPQPTAIPNISPTNNGPNEDDATEDEDEDDDDDGDDDDDDEDTGPASGVAGVAGVAAADLDETDPEDSDHLDDSEGDDNYDSEEFQSRPKLRLREILFYDDKVAIFKARHGKL